jgi:hypothetical protein
MTKGEFRDQEDAEWVVISRSLWGHNYTACGQLAPGRPIGRMGSGQGVFGGFSYYRLVMLISNTNFNIVPLILEFTCYILVGKVGGRDIVLRVRDGRPQGGYRCKDYHYEYMM